MGIRDLVNKFTSGELDPKFIAEVDYDGYRKSARKLRNVIAFPQGGATRRFGTQYEQTIMDAGVFITNVDQVRLIGYEHQNNEHYYIVIRPSAASVVAFDIYLGSLFQVTVAAPATTYTVAMIRDIRWVKDYDRLILLHQQVPPYELRRISAAVWQLNLIQFQFFPTFDFTSSDNPATLPTPNTPYTSPVVTFTPDAVAATQITASIAVFTSNHVGGLYYGNSGIFRITGVNPGGTIATGFIINDFASTAPIRGDLSVLLERAWNDGLPIAGAPAGIARFWPSHGTFYQSRLVLGGSIALPGIAFASVVREYYNFDDSESQANDGWGVELGVTGNDIIVDILASKSLILIGNKGPASTSILLNEPTTPTNAFLNTQGSEGARNIDAVIIDNQVIYADRAGNTIWSMSYEVPDTGYNISNISILSAQLVRSPRWADIFDPDNIDGRYYMLVNSDGSMAVYDTIIDQNIKSWSLATTTGSFIDVASVANECKALVRRKVSTGIVITGAIDQFYLVDDTFTGFRNVTVNINAAFPVEIFANLGDYILIGNEIPFTALQFNLTILASTNLLLTFEFLNDTGTWESFVPLDGTIGFTASGNITWPFSSVNNWTAQTLDNTTLIFGDLPVKYWIRIKRTAITVVTEPLTFTAFINSENRIYLERLDFNLVMDMTVTTSSNGLGIVSGLNAYNGQNVFVFSDGFPIGTFYVDGGSFLLETQNVILPSAIVTVGLDFTVNLTPMPVIALLGNGISVYEPAKVVYLYVDFYQSLGVTIQGQNIPQISPGTFMVDQIPVPQTGYYKQPSFGGWDPREEFVISQSYPAPMNILAVSYTLEVAP